MRIVGTLGHSSDGPAHPLAAGVRICALIGEEKTLLSLVDIKKSSYP